MYYDILVIYVAENKQKALTEMALPRLAGSSPAIAGRPEMLIYILIYNALFVVVCNFSGADLWTGRDDMACHCTIGIKFHTLFSFSG